MKQSRLGPGQKSLERGSTFATRGRLRSATGMQPMDRAPLHVVPGDDDHTLPPPKRKRRRFNRAGNLGASAAQRRKTRDGACIVTGATEGIDSAHLWDRSLGGCDDPLCTVPLRRDVHEAYDRHEFDLLPHLIAHGRVAELQHALGHARGDLIGLLNRLTGEQWHPEPKRAA